MVSEMSSESTPPPAENTPPLAAKAPSADVAPSSRRHGARKIALALVALALIYVAASYIIIPLLLKRYAHRHPGLEDIPGVAYTGSGIPADPLNVALVGSKAEVMHIMVAAKWYPADPLTLRSCLEIAAASVLARPYDAAPVSSEYLFGRKEDLAFEKPVGDDPRHRHHVRFWRCPKEDADGRPVWIGSAIYDKRVGFSHTTGQITHITSPDVDAERDYLFADLERTGELSETYFIDDFHKVRQGRNGEGEPWYTDGRLEVGIIKVRATQ